MKEVIAARVKARMEALGMKRVDLIRNAGVSGQTIDGLLRAEKDYSLSVLTSVANGLGMSLREFLGAGLNSPSDSR